MENFLSNLKIHALAILLWFAAFFMWKDYFQQPRQMMERGKYTYFTGTYSSAGNEIYLPSGHSGNHYIILKEASRTFIPEAIDWSAFIDEVPTDTKFTVGFSPEEDPKVSGKGIRTFSLKYNNKEYINDQDAVTWYNKSIIKRRNTALYFTLAGFAAFGLVWWIKRRFFK
ncbi:MAG: hypothetical protein V4556_12415 [Bacteroidota bacterium]